MRCVRCIWWTCSPNTLLTKKQISFWKTMPFKLGWDQSLFLLPPRGRNNNLSLPFLVIVARRKETTAVCLKFNEVKEKSLVHFQSLGQLTRSGSSATRVRVALATHQCRRCMHGGLRGPAGAAVFMNAARVLFFFSPKPAWACHAVAVGNKTCWHDRPLAASLHYRDTVSSDELLRQKGGGERREKVETAS